MLRPVFVASLFALIACSAEADSCSSVIPGAQMGPSPTFNSWPFENACYISWPGGYIGGQNARFTYEPKCKQVPGFLHFEGDYGSNKNTCIFTAPSNDSTVDAGSNDAVPSQPSQPARTANRSKSAEFKGRIIAETNEGISKFKSGQYEAAQNLLLRISIEIFDYDQKEKLSWTQEELNVLNFSTCLHEIATRYYWMQFGSPSMSDSETCASAFKLSSYAREQWALMIKRSAETASARSNRATNATSSDRRSGAVKVDANCLIVGKHKDTGVGCGLGKMWIRTFFSVSQDPSLSCPKVVNFTFNDENGPQKGDAPTDTQVCGGPPTNIQVVDSAR